MVGGSNDSDSSGIIKYTSIRYGGGRFYNDIIMGNLVFIGCGSKTVIHHVESLYSFSDSFDFWGGSVNCKHLASIQSRGFCSYNLYYRGKLQFIFEIEQKKDSEYESISAFFEYSGRYQEFQENLNECKLFNSTLIGNYSLPDTLEWEHSIRYSNNGKGSLNNSIVCKYDMTPIYISEDSEINISNNDIEITNNLWWVNESYPTFESMNVQENVIPYLNANNNIITDPRLYGISRTNNGGLDPRPRPESPAWTMELADYPDDGFFEPVNYAGAFGTENWLEGWSWLWQMGYFDTTATSIRLPNQSLPAEYKLEQNYPNPFNPKSKIKFQIEKSGHVELIVYDLLGKEITKLVNEYKSSGSYEVVFDGSNLSSGVYFYTLKSGAYVETRKMILLK